MKLIDEIHTFVQAASHPIGNLLVKGVAMGTSHTAAVTGTSVYFSDFRDTILPSMIYMLKSAAT
jgi:hypothetical protein